MAVERRCPGCGKWYLKRLGACPECEQPAAKFNKWLRTAQLNAHLYASAERSISEAKQEKQILKDARR